MTSVLASIVLFAGVSLIVPGEALGAMTAKVSLCAANLRTSASTTAHVRYVLPKATKVSIAARITGSRYRTSCAGRTATGSTWYRISMINGTSVKARFGVTYLYAATTLFKDAPFLRYAACDTPLRTSASNAAPSKTTAKTNTSVIVATSVTGARWSATCGGRTMSGTIWYRITSVGGRSVRANYGVSALYAPNGRFKAMLAAPPVVAPSVPGTKALGVYVHNSAWNYSLLDSYASSVGGMPAMALSYNDWAATGDGGNLFPRAMLDAFTARGITPIVTWEPWNWNGSGSDPTYKLANILRGDFDAYISTWVAGARTYAKPMYLRFAHEMNGNWYPWGLGVNGNTPAQYVAVWQKIVTAFRSGGATNVRFVWSPNVNDLGDKPLTGLYPGDAYVDLTAMDGYNWGTTRAGAGGWRSFATIFGTTYDQIGVMAPTKPIFVAETASTEYGGDKAAWIRDAYASVPTDFPRLAGVIWFDQNKETDWRVESSAGALAAYRAVVAQADWAGGLP